MLCGAKSPFLFSFLFSLLFFQRKKSPAGGQRREKNEKENSEEYKKKKPLTRLFLFGAPEGTRTPDLLVRSQTLYPAELPAHMRRLTA